MWTYFCSSFKCAAFFSSTELVLGPLLDGEVTDTNLMLLQTEPRHLLYLIVLLGNIEPLFAINVGTEGVENTKQMDGTRDQMTQVRLQARKYFGWLWNFMYSAFEALKRTAVNSYVLPKRPLIENETCYPRVGCFFANESMRLEIGGPQSPEEVNATFYFFDNASSTDVDDLLNDTKKIELPEKTWTLENWTLAAMNNTINFEKPLMVVTHGLTGSKRTPWMEPLVLALLENLNCNVLVVDWEKGANGSYTDAGVNTPMTGAIISLFLQKVINETQCLIRPENITLVGFSMGAQVMGFVGRHFQRTAKMTLGRITGLDPAGHLFQGTNVVLNRSDAKFVDVIHTQGGDIYDLKIGLNQSVGHVDFYPNGGSVQEGCPSSPSFTKGDIMGQVTCSHYRAPRLYIESLKNRSCSFVSYHCAIWEDYVNEECVKNATPSDIGEMGYYSFLARGRGNQYLYTNPEPPYCRGNRTTHPQKTNKTLKEAH